jgi:integrase
VLARETAAKRGPAAKASRKAKVKNVFEVGGVELPPGLRPRSGGFQADLRAWGRGQVILRHSVTGMKVTDPAVAKAEYEALCRTLSGDAARIANGLASVESLHPSHYVAEFVRLKYAKAERELQATLARKFGTIEPSKRDRQRAMGYVQAIDHFLERIFTETSFKELTSIQQITRKRVTTLVGELHEMRVRHPVAMPVQLRANLAALPAEMAAEAAARWDRDANHLSSATIRRMMMALSALMSHAVDNGDYEGGNPCSRHKAIPPQYKYSPATWLEIDEANRILEYLATTVTHWRNPYAYEMAATLLYTGMRKDEMMLMSPDQLDFRAKAVHVRGSKTERSVARTVRLWPAYEAIMRPFYEREGLLDGNRVIAKRALLFPGRPRAGKQGEAKVQKRDSMLSLLKRVARAVGITKQIVHHTTRHTYVSVRIQMVEHVNGRTVNVTKDKVRREIGHDHESTLDKVYAHALEGRYAMEELDYGWKADASER